MLGGGGSKKGCWNNAVSFSGACCMIQYLIGDRFPEQFGSYGMLYLIWDLPLLAVPPFPRALLVHTIRCTLSETCCCRRLYRRFHEHFGSYDMLSLIWDLLLLDVPRFARALWFIRHHVLYLIWDLLLLLVPRFARALWFVRHDVPYLRPVAAAAAVPSLLWAGFTMQLLSLVTVALSCCSAAVSRATKETHRNRLKRWRKRARNIYSLRSTVHFFFFITGILCLLLQQCYWPAGMIVWYGTLFQLHTWR